MYSLLISDLHLDPRHPQTIEAFLHLMQTSSDADAIYILGDFVEYWIGDDDNEHGLETVFEHLKMVAANGTALYLMHGNRDFLIGEHFVKRNNIQLLTDPCVINLYGTSTLLMHGDTLCTDDIAYQNFRAMVRDPKWQATFLNKPLAERRKIVKGLRETSRQATEAKAEEIMDVNQGSVEQMMLAHQTRRLIHGHTHRPGHHQFTLQAHEYERWVLGDWYKEAWILRCDAGGCEFKTIPIQ